MQIFCIAEPPPTLLKGQPSGLQFGAFVVILRQQILSDNGKYPNITIGANLKNEPQPDLEKIKLTADKYLDVTNGIRTYEYKHYFYPIPSGEITLNPNLGQNPGWEE